MRVEEGWVIMTDAGGCLMEAGSGTVTAGSPGAPSLKSFLDFLCACDTNGIDQGPPLIARAQPCMRGLACAALLQSSKPARRG